METVGYEVLNYDVPEGNGVVWLIDVDGEHFLVSRVDDFLGVEVAIWPTDNDVFPSQWEALFYKNDHKHHETIREWLSKR